MEKIYKRLTAKFFRKFTDPQETKMKSINEGKFLENIYKKPNIGKYFKLKRLEWAGHMWQAGWKKSYSKCTGQEHWKKATKRKNLSTVTGENDRGCKGSGQ